MSAPRPEENGDNLNCAFFQGSYPAAHIGSVSAYIQVKIFILPSRSRAIILPVASVGAVFHLPIPSDSGRAGRGQPCLFRVRENQKLLPF